ncbi:MAG: hypothetical protein V3W41_19670 [Planctomycetota bacterium]
MARVPGVVSVGGRNPSGSNPIIFVVVVGLVMGGALLWLFNLDTRERKQIEVSLPQRKITISDDAPLWNPQTETWGAVNDTNRDGQSEVPTKALGVACNRVASHSWNAFALRGTILEPDRIGFQRLDIPSYFQAPRALRGQPVEVVGELISLEKVDVFEKYEGLKVGKRFELYEGVIKPRENLHGSGVPVFFTLVDDPKNALPTLGEPVKLQGVFFKLQEILQGQPEVGLWLLGKTLHRNFRVPELDAIDLDLLTDVKDVKQAMNRSLPFGEEAFWHLAADVVRRGDRDRGEPIELSKKKSQELLSDPEKYRGKYVEMRARILKVDQFGMNAFFPTNAAGDNAVDGIWNTYLTTNGDSTVTVMWLKKPNLDLDVADEVIIRGVFYRVWGFKSREGFSRSPLVIGVGDIEVYKRPSNAFSGIILGFAVFCLLCVVLVALVLRRDRRRSELFRKSLNAKKKLQRGRVDLNEVARHSE